MNAKSVSIVICPHPECDRGGRLEPGEARGPLLNTAGGVVRRVKLRRIHAFGTRRRAEARYRRGAGISSSSSTAITTALPAPLSASLGSVLEKSFIVLSEGWKKVLSSARALTSRSSASCSIGCLRRAPYKVPLKRELPGGKPRGGSGSESRRWRSESPS